MHFNNLRSDGGCASDTVEAFTFDAYHPDEKFKLREEQK
jgi:hypothetical protein